MKKSLIALALVSAFAAPAMAEETPVHSFTANVGVVTDYIFRGISQTQHAPALQGGVDYAHVSGLYAGVWGSTIRWVDRNDYEYHRNNDLELDLYGGYKTTFGDFSLDVGMIRYYYPGDFSTANNLGNPTVTVNTTEAYIAGGWKWVSLKYSRALSKNFIGWGGTGDSERSKGSDYIDLTLTYPVDETFNVIAHIGHQNVRNNSYANYTDWKIGVTKDLGFGVVGLAYTDTNARYNDGANNAATYDSAYNWSNKDVAKGVVAASFTKTF